LILNVPFDKLRARSLLQAERLRRLFSGVSQPTSYPQAERLRRLFSGVSQPTSYPQAEPVEAGTRFLRCVTANILPAG